MKVPFSRPDDDDPVVRAGRNVFERDPGVIEEPAAAAAAATGAPASPNQSQRGTRVLVGVALVAILAGAALVAIPTLSGDDGDASDALPASWPPDDGSQVWAEPASNPAAAECGESVGLLIDRSVPVDPGRSVPNLSVTTDAARSFVRGIGITPTPVGFWSFGTYSDPFGEEDFGEPGGVVDFPARLPVPVAGLAGRDDLADVEAGLGSIPFGFTSLDSDQVELSERNWEAGLRAVLESGEAPRTLVMVTTGDPTTHDGDDEREKGVDLLDLDAAIEAANELKATGTRIVVVGVEGADRIALETISGPDAGDAESLELGDSYSVDRDGLSATLDHIAAAQCGGTVTVDKSVQELAGDDPVAGEGWEYRLSVDGDLVEETSTDQLGLATMGWQDVDAVLLQEAGKEGYQLPLSGGAQSESGATCRRAGPDETVSGLDVPGGFELEVDPSQIIGCSFASVRSYVDLVLDLEPVQQSAPPGTSLRYDISYRNAGTLPATGAVVQVVVPEGATLSASDNEHPWRCPDGFPARAGAVCTFSDPAGTLEPASPFYAFWLAIRVDEGTDRPEIETRALVMSEGLEDPVPEDNVVAVITPTSDVPPPTTTVPATTTTTVPPPTTTTTTIPPTTTSTTTSTTTTTTSTTTTTTTTSTTTTTTTTTLPPPPPPPPPTTPPPTTTSTTVPSTTTTSTTLAPPVPVSDDLVLTLSADGAEVMTGENIGLTAVAENEGEAALTAATLTIAAPTGTTFDPRSSDVGWRCQDDVICSIDIGTVDPGGAVDVGATMRVLEPNGRSSVEFAASLQGEAAGTTVAASGSADVTLATVDLGVELETVEEPVAGEVARFRVAVSNVGETPATQVELNLDLPAPLEFDALSGSDAASCLRISGRCQFREIAPGATEIVTASWRVPSSLPSETVEVSAAVTTSLSDTEPSNNAAVLATTVDGIRVEALATPSGIFDDSDSSTWLGVAAGVISALLIAWIIVGGMRRKRPDATEPDGGSQPDGP